MKRVQQKFLLVFFKDCTGLTEITIPEGVTTIGDYAFSSCTELTKIVLSKSVKSISSSTFYNCSKITIYGYAGSYAETYAKKYSIPFAKIGTDDNDDNTDNTDTVNPVTVFDSVGTKTFKDLTSALNAYKTTTKPLTITLNADANVKTLSLPTKAASITFEGDGVLNVNSTSISIPTNTTFNVTLNGAGSQPLAVRVSAGKTLMINGETDNIGAISGTKTSNLNINEDVKATSVATFGEVNVAEGKVLTLTSKISAVNKLNGAVKLPTSKATATTVTAGNAEIILTDGNIAKVTMTDVTEALNVKIVNENDEIVEIGSGIIVLYSTKDISEKVTISNKTSDEKELNAFYYKKNKAIKAEWADAVTLSYGGTNRMFPNIELALEGIKDKGTDYTITLNTDITAPTFVIPISAQSITIKSDDEDQKVINLINITTISVKIPLVIENVAIESTKPLSISTTGDLKLNNFTSTSITAVKGGAKAMLTLGKTSLIDKVSLFGTTRVTDEFRIGTTFTTTSLELTENACLIVSNTKVPASAKTLIGTEGSCIKFEEDFTPMRITGTTNDSIGGAIKLESDGKITDNTILFSTKCAGNNVFDVTEIIPEETDFKYTVTSINGKIYIKPIIFELNEKGYALWNDVIIDMENANASEATYTVHLLYDFNINGALKFPRAGTYKKITIDSENKTLKFAGSVTATGELEVLNTNLDSVNNGRSAKYVLTINKFPFNAENTNLNLASISGTADVTLENVTTNGTIKAGKLKLNGINTVWGTITATEIGSTKTGTVLNVLYSGKSVLNATQNGITVNSEEITIKLVDANETPITAVNKSIISSSFKGSYDGQFILSTENGAFSIVLINGRLVLADVITISMNAFEDIDENIDSIVNNSEEADNEDALKEDDSDEETTIDDEGDVDKINENFLDDYNSLSDNNNQVFLCS